MECKPVLRGWRALGIGCVAVLAACLAIFLLELYKPPRVGMVGSPTRDGSPIRSYMRTHAPTHRSVPTTTPMIYPPTPPLVVSDTFADRQNLPQPRVTPANFGYETQSYVLTPPLQPGYIHVLHQNFGAKPYRNLSLNVLAAPVVGSVPVEYGIIFWHGEDPEGRERFLSFTVSTAGTFRLRAFEPLTRTAQGALIYQWTDLVPATTARASIDAPPGRLFLDGKPNHLRVDVHPQRLLAYINDELVIDIGHEIISEWRNLRDFDGRVGLIAIALGEEGAKARFSRFDIFADIQQP